MRLTIKTITRRSRPAKWALALLTFIGVGSTALAAPIEVKNHSFEAAGLDPGGWDNELGTDWVGQAGSNSGDAFMEHIEGFASEGKLHVGLQNEYFVYQRTGTPVEPNTTYTLIVGVGNRNEAFSPEGALAIIGLTALEEGAALTEATAVAQVAADPFLPDISITVDSFPAGASTFVDHTLRFTTGAEVPAGNVTIFLGDDPSAGRAHFDNVRLYAQPGGTSIGADVEFQAAARANKPIVLDGDLSEWNAHPIVNPPFGLGADAAVLDFFEPFGGGTWDGAEDQSTTTWFTWDDDNIFLGVVVTDDYHEHAAEGPGGAWNGDAIQLHVANPARDTQVALYNYALVGVEGALGDVVIHDEAGPAGSEAAITRNGTQTTYEIKLPKASVGLENLLAGTQLGLGMTVNDGDELEPGQKGWGGLGAHSVVFGKTPGETALVTLGRAAGEILVDFGNSPPNANGTAPGWIGVSNLVQDQPFSLGGGVSITALEDGFNPNNPAGPGADGDIDGRIVPQNVLDDYLFKITDTADTSAQMRIDGLPAGNYDITVFEGRTTDAGQVGKIWVGDEPADPNTGDFAAGKFGTVSVSVADGDSVFYRHLEDGSGGISGMIIAPVAPVVGDPSGFVAGGPEAAGPAGLRGAYWSLPPKGVPTTDNPMHRADNGAANAGWVDNNVYNTAPSGNFVSTDVNYAGEGRNDLTPVVEWLGADGASYSGAMSDFDDGVIRLTGYIYVDAPGAREITTNSDDGSAIYIANQLVAQHDNGHGQTGAVGDAEGQIGTIDFPEAGYYPVDIRYFNGDWTSPAGDHGGANLSTTGLEGLVQFVAGGDSVGLPFHEDFDRVVLGPNVDETAPGDNVWTNVPPGGWSVDNSAMAPGGVMEWQGWTFADPDWWAEAAGDQRRSEFTKASGAAAIADPDEWDDIGSPSGAGTFNSFLSSPALDVAGVNGVNLGFDFSWRPEVDQVGNVTVSFDRGDAVEVFRLDTATSTDENTNSTASVDIAVPGGASSMVVTFGLFDAGNNWFWAIDNVSVAAAAPELIACWDFQETQDGFSFPTTTDIIGGNAAELIGPASLTAYGAGATGQDGDVALDLGGAGGALFADGAFLNDAMAGDAVTVMFWQQLRSTPNSSSFWMISPSSSNAERGFQAHVPWSNEIIYMDTAGCCEPPQRINKDNAGFTWDQWHHYAFVKNGANKEIWIDGALFHSGTDAAALPSDITQLWIGSAGEAGNSIDGWLDEFRIFKGALNGAQIEEWMAFKPIAPAPEAAAPLAIAETGLDGDEPTTVGSGFGEDSLTFSDRTHEHNSAAFNADGVLAVDGENVIGLPAYLLGGDFLMFANNARDNVDYEGVATSASASYWYLLVDNRLNGPAGDTSSPNSEPPVLGGALQWIIDGGWIPVKTGISPNGQVDFTGVDESGDGGLNQFYSVFALPNASNTATVRSNGIGGSNMISLVSSAIAPPALDPDVTAPDNEIALVNGVNDGDANEGPPPGAEGVENSINNIGQKYLNFLDLGSGFAVTPAGATVLSGARFYPANDAEERDPASFLVEGSTAGIDGPWETIAGGDLSLPTARNAGGDLAITGDLPNQVVLFNNDAAYASYRVTFPTLKDAEAANSMQIAEVELLGVPGSLGGSQVVVYSQNFDGFDDGTTDLGDGTVMAGTANIVGGQLQLTENDVAGGFASFSIPGLAGSSQGWTATFDLTIIDGEGANPPADGFSLNYGNAALGELGSAEEGMAGVESVTENLSFEIDSWMNFDEEQGVNIAEKVGGVDTNLAFTNGPILDDGTTVSGQVVMKYDPVNGASFSTTGLNTNADFVDVPTSFVGNDAYTFIFSGRVGGANETKWIDNLVITVPGSDFASSLVLHYDFETGSGDTVINLAGGAGGGEEVANSATGWVGTDEQGANGWTYGYRDLAVDAPVDYDPAADFIAFPADWWNGTAWDEPNADGDNIPWTTVAEVQSHPNGPNSGDLHHWAIRRWASNVDGLVNIEYSVAKANTNGGNGVTGAVHVNGVRVDSAVIEGTDGVGVTKSVQVNLASGDVVDLVHSPVGTDGTDNDGSDGSNLTMTITTLGSGINGTFVSTGDSPWGTSDGSTSLGGPGVGVFDSDNSAESTYVDTNQTPADLGVMNHDYTMMALARQDAIGAGGDAMIFGQDAGDTGEVLHHGARNSDLYMAHWGDDINSSADAVVAPPAQVDLGNWHHFAYVYQGGETGTLSLYRDGVLVAQGERGGLRKSSTNILIGTTRPDQDRDFIGLLDDVRIYNTAATAEQVFAAYCNANVVDCDGDGMADADEIAFFGDLSRDGTRDFDGDRLNDASELALGSDPTSRDTDGDGLWDGEEVWAVGSSPLVADSDGDGLGDREEYDDLGSDPNDEDSDNDGRLDGDRSLANGLIGYWPFDGSLADVVGGSDGVGVGADPIEFTADAAFGQGIDLNGVDQYVDSQEPSKFDFADGTGFSVSAWFRVDGFTKNWQALIASGEGSDWRVHRQADQDNFAPVAGGQNADGGGVDIGQGSTSVNDGALHHVVITNIPGESSNYYLDGVLIETGPAGTPSGNPETMKIGENPQGLGRTWDGLIDDVAIWNRGLSAQEVSQLSSGPSLGAQLKGPAELLVHYDFSGGAGFAPLYAQNFDGVADGTSDLGDGSLIANTVNDTSTVVLGGALRLTDDPTGSQNAFYKTPTLNGLAGGFQVSFDLSLFDEAGGNPPADGLSINVGNIADDATAGEEGFGAGLAVEFDTWDNGGEGADNGIGIDISVDGADVAINREAAGADPNNNAFFQFDGVYRHVNIAYTPAATGGLLDVTYGDLVIAAGLPVDWTPADGDRLAFAARTGGATEELLIDNVFVGVPSAVGVQNLGSAGDGLLVGPAGTNLADLLSTPLGDPTASWTELAGADSIPTFNGAFDGADLLDGTWRVWVDFEAKTEGTAELIFETGGGTVGTSIVYEAPSTIVMRSVGNGGNDVLTAHAPLSQADLDAGAHELIFTHDGNSNGPETIAIYLNGQLAGSATGEKSNDFSGGNGASFGLGTNSLAAGGGNTNLPGGAVDFTSGSITLDPGLQFFRDTLYIAGALRLAGVNGDDAVYVDTQNSSDALGMNGPMASYTALARIRPDSVDGDNMVFGQLPGDVGELLHNGVRGNQIHFGHWGSDSNSGSATVDAGNFYDVAWRFRGGVQSIFLNGELVGRSVQPLGLRNPANVLVGIAGNDGAFEGLIDDVKIYGGALSQKRIQIVQGRAPLADEFLLVSYQFENGITTTIKNDGNLGAPNGHLSSTDVMGAFGTGSPSANGPGVMFFNDVPGADGTHVNTGLTAAQAGLNGATNYTMMTWALPTSDRAGDQMIFGQPDGNALHNGIRDQRLHIGHWGNDLNAAASPVAFNKWQHLAFTYDVAGNQTVYINGVATETGVFGGLDNPDQDILVGLTRFADDRDYEGWLDDVRIYNTTLNAAQITEIAGLIDSDGDGLLDPFERAYFGDLAMDGNGDPDGDGLTNAMEIENCTDPTVFTEQNRPDGATIDILGTGAESLLGGDLTDLNNDGLDALGGATDPSWDWVGITSSHEPDFEGGENAFNIFDNKVGGGNDKWCCDDPTPDAPVWVSVEFANPVSLTHFTITNGNDSPDRDPTNWAIQGSNDGENFENIFTETEKSIWSATRNEVALVTLEHTSAPYTHLRYIAWDTPGTLHQLNEIEYFGGGLLAYWDFNDGSGDPLDLVGGVPAVLTGGADYGDGYEGTAIDFGATDEGQTLIVDPSILQPIADHDQLTVAFWQNLHNVANSSAFWATTDEQDRSFQAHTPWGNGTIFFDSGGGCCDPPQRISAPVDTPPGTWQHLAFVKRGSEKTVYVDGVEAFAGSDAARISGVFQTFSIGSNNGGSSLQGSIDEFSIWSLALSKADIEDLAAGGKPDVPTGEPLHPLAEGLLGYWPFDGSLDDVVGGSNGLAVGADPIEYTDEAAFGQGIDLNGVDQYVDSQEPSKFDFADGTGFSVSAWFRVDGFTKNWQALIASGEGSDWRVHRQAGLDNFAPVAGGQNADGGGVDIGQGSTSVNDGALHHVVITNVPGDSSNYYLDGVLIETGPAGTPSGNDETMKIGENPQGLGRTWDGLIDDVAIWNRGLSADEVAQLNAGPSLGDIISGPVDGGTVAYSQNFDGFDDGTTDLGDGTVMAGTTQIVGGQLQLTENDVAGGFASFSIPGLAGSSQGWTATFDLTIIDGEGANPPADGFSLNYGNAALGELGSAEEGMAGVESVTDNLSFEIDSWMNFDEEQGVNIAEKVGGVDTDLAFTNGPILDDGTTVSGKVVMTYDPVNGASFSTTGLLTNADFADVPTSFVGDDTYTFIFSGRVGGANETKWIDNLVITLNAASGGGGGGELLMNGSFEDPVLDNINTNNLGTAPVGWSQTGDPATWNLIRNDGSVYGSGVDNAADGSQILDLNGIFDIFQNFSLAEDSTVTFGASFANREGHDGSPPSTVGIYDASGATLVSPVVSVDTSADPTPSDVWRSGAASTSLPAGDYQIRIALNNFNNVDAIFAYAGDPRADAVASSSGPVTEPTLVDFGTLSGDASFEFAVNANKGGGSTAIAGNDAWALKLEQWQDTGFFGTTAFGVADNLSGAPTIFGANTHVVFVSDTAAGVTRIYVNGALAGTAAGNPDLSGAGSVLGAVRAAGNFQDPVGEGSVMHAWASYDTVLSHGAIAALALNAFGPQPIAYWPLDEIVDGVSPDVIGGRDMTAVNLTTDDVVSGAVGNAISFVGERETLLQYIAADADDVLPVNSANTAFTVAFWSKIKGTGQNDWRIFSEASTTDGNPLFNIGTHNAGADDTVDLFIRSGGSTGHLHTTATALDGDWHHILYVQDGATASFYIDGVADDLVIDPTAGPLAGAGLTDTTTIGGILRADASHWVTGVIDDVKIWDVALTPDQIAAAAGPPVSAVSSALVAHFSLDADGNSGVGGFTASTEADVTYGAAGANGNTGTSASFNGTSSVIQHDWSADLNPESFTLALWARSDGGAGAWNSPVTSRHDLNPDSQGYLIYDNQPDGNWTFWSGNGTAEGNWQVLDGPAVTVGDWEHVAISYDSATETKKLYVNGTLAVEANDAVFPNDTTPFNIGAGQDFGDGFWFVGDLDDIGLWNVALTEAEVQVAMNDGVLAVNPSAAAQRTGTPTIVDSDRDGMSDLAETIAGTDPNDRNDFFHIGGIASQADGVAISFEGVAGRVYEIEFSPDLQPGSWGMVGAQFAEKDGTVNFVGPHDSGQQGFYRARVIQD